MWLETKDSGKHATFGKVNCQTRRTFKHVVNKFDDVKVFLSPCGGNDQMILILQELIF